MCWIKTLYHAHNERNAGWRYGHYLSPLLGERIGEINPGADIREWNGLTSVIFRKTFAPNIKPVLEHFKSNNQSYNFCRHAEQLFRGGFILFDFFKLYDIIKRSKMAFCFFKN